VSQSLHTLDRTRSATFILGASGQTLITRT